MISCVLQFLGRREVWLFYDHWLVLTRFTVSCIKRQNYSAICQDEKGAISVATKPHDDAQSVVSGATASLVAKSSAQFESKMRDEQLRRASADDRSTAEQRLLAVCYLFSSFLFLFSVLFILFFHRHF